LFGRDVAQTIESVAFNVAESAGAGLHRLQKLPWYAIATFGNFQVVCAEMCTQLCQWLPYLSHLPRMVSSLVLWHWAGCASQGDQVSSLARQSAWLVFLEVPSEPVKMNRCVCVL
jgi:hypothetical protein